MSIAYTALASLALPMALSRLLYKARRDRRYLAHLGERFGRFPCAGNRCDIWFHAVSVGEVAALVPLVEALRRAAPGLCLLVSVTTPTGRAAAKAALGDAAEIRYLPYDLPPFVSAVLDRVRPRALITVERELWPNLFRAAAARGCTVWVVNARLTERSAASYRRVWPIVAPAFDAVTGFFAQSSRDARHLAALGVAEGRIEVAGNLKFDRALPGAVRPAQRRCLALGCLRRGEEQTVVPAVAELAAAFGDLEVLVCPRQIGDAGKFAQAFAAAGLPVHRLECVAEIEDLARPVVALYDRMGGLGEVYARASVAYVGGALVPLGGHSVAEAAGYGLPVIVGPHHDHNADAVAALADVGALRIVTDSEGFVAAASVWLADPAVCREAGGQARDALQRMRGASGRIVATLKQNGLLDESVA